LPLPYLHSVCPPALVPRVLTILDEFWVCRHRHVQWDQLGRRSAVSSSFLWKLFNCLSVRLFCTQCTFGKALSKLLKDQPGIAVDVFVHHQDWYLTTLNARSTEIWTRHDRPLQLGDVSKLHNDVYNVLESAYALTIFDTTKI